VWSSLTEATSLVHPLHTVEPRTSSSRAQWHEAVRRARGWIPELSALDF
jgi:hypothetical protein